jgi:hypothetical protein
MSQKRLFLFLLVNHYMVYPLLICYLLVIFFKASGLSSKIELIESLKSIILVSISAGNFSEQIIRFAVSSNYVIVVFVIFYVESAKCHNFVDT